MKEQKYYVREGRRFVQVDSPQQTVQTSYEGKYYQSDGSFVDSRTPDSIGLCILSSNGFHTVMVLEEVPGKYNHEEAKEKAVRFFNGKGDIPSQEEMLLACIRYKKELNLVAWRDYRAFNSHFGLTADGTLAVLRSAYVYDSPSTAFTAIGSGWYDLRVALRPVMRIKMLNNKYYQNDQSSK